MGAACGATPVPAVEGLEETDRAAEQSYRPPVRRLSDADDRPVAILAYRARARGPRGGASNDGDVEAEVFFLSPFSPF